MRLSKPLSVVWFFTILWCLPNTYGYSQSYRIDSVKRLLQTHPSIGRVQLLSELCFQLNSNGKQDSLKKYADELLTLAEKDIDKKAKVMALFFLSQAHRKDSVRFLEYTRQSKSLAQSIHYPMGIALNCLGQGTRYRVTGKYDAAILILQEGIQIMHEARDRRSKEILADLFSALSSIYHNQGKYADALAPALESNNLADELSDTIRLIKSYNNLSAAYGELSSSENNLGSPQDRSRYRSQSKVYTRKSFEISLHQSNKRMPALAAYNLGLLLNEEIKLDSSNYYLRKAIQLGEEINYDELLANSYSVIGLNFAKLNTDSALYYFNRSIRFAEQSELKALLASMLINKANIINERGDITAAYALATQSLKLNLETSDMDGAMASNLLLSTLNERKGDLKKALQFHRQYILLKDSILNQKNFAKLEEVQTRFETTLKDKEIKNLSQQAAIQELTITQRTYWLLSLIIFVVMASGVVFLIIRQRQTLARKKMADIETRLLRSQLNPHFLFNALSAIQQYIYEQPDRMVAADYLGKFSSLTRRILNNTREEYISLAQEIEFLEDYLSLQKIRFEIPFDYTLHISDQIETEDVYLPPMITQPFIENSIEHGILHKKEKGKIDIYFDIKGTTLEVIIQDNGIGREQATFNKRNKKHRSLATEITRERLAHLEMTHHQKAFFTIDDLLNESGLVTGTRVLFVLPLIEEI